MRIRSLLAASAVLLPLAGVSGGAHAQNLNALLAGCASLPTQQARMECYEGVSRGSKGAGGGSVAPAPAPAPSTRSSDVASTAAPAASSPSGFGSDSFKRSSAERRHEDRVNRIEARVTSAVVNGIGRWTIALEDGAKWRMTETVATFQPPQANDVVTIRRSAMGGYMMDVNGQASVYVTRIQ